MRSGSDRGGLRLVRLLFPLAGLLGIGLMTSCEGRGASAWPRLFARDSLTLRVWHKWNGSPSGYSTYGAPVEWGWDSVTWRAVPGDSLPYPSIHMGFEVPGLVQLDMPVFRLGSRFARDSAVLYYRGVCLLPNGPPKHAHRFTWDSVTVTHRPRYFSLYELTGDPILKIALLGRESPTADFDTSTSTVHGRLVTEWSRVPVPGKVYVLHTSIRALADSSGRFTLHGVPVGVAELHAIYPGKGWLIMDTNAVVPCDTITLGMRFGRPGRP